MEQKSVNLEQAQGQAIPHARRLAGAQTAHRVFTNWCKNVKHAKRKIETNWQFCAHCGVRLASECPGCGKPLPPAGAPSCLNCGLAIPTVSV